MRNAITTSIGVALVAIPLTALPAAAQTAQPAPETTIQVTPTRSGTVQAIGSGAPAAAASESLGTPQPQTAPVIAPPRHRAIAVAPTGRVYWEVLHDTTLNRLLDRSMDGNLDLRA